MFLTTHLLVFKNTLLQELENTQKQIEEQQHDKVNAITKPCVRNTRHIYQSYF